MKTELEIVKGITEGELEYISNADYGLDAKKHKEALKTLIHVQNCVIQDSQYWFPYEVVELTRWFCKEGHEREFAMCNIIIALSIIAGADGDNDPRYMLEEIAPEYEKLPASLKEPVLNILRQAENTLKADE